jgi:hypothetical protein
MADLMKAPSLPTLPELFNKLAPVDTPELTYKGAGLIRGTIHKARLRRMAEVSDHEARIAKNRAEVTRYTCDAIIDAMTFAERYETVMKGYKHQRDMMDATLVTAQATAKKTVAEAAEAEYSARITHLDYQMRKKAMQKELGDDFQDQDRD